MKQHDGGLRGGHKRIGRGPVRRVCFTCRGEFVGVYPECNRCRGAMVRALPVKRESEDEPPPLAA